MTEPREPHDPDLEPQGLAEGIRHEIEEVVEHVPRPVRWTVGKLVRLAVLALVGLVLVVVVTAILYVTNRTEWAARELALLVNQALVSHSDVAIEIGDLKGNLLSGVRVLQARVRFREGDEPALLEAPEIRLRYSAWALATGGRGPIVVEIDRPVVRLTRGADGRYRLPTWKSVPARGPRRARDFSLRLRDAALFTPDTALRIRGLYLDAQATIGEGTRVDVRSLRWSSGPYRSVLEAGAFEYAATDSARLLVRELRTSDVTMHGLASWAPGASEAAVHLEVDRLRWRWLYEISRNHDLDVDGEGRVVVDARGGRALAGRFEAGGVWDSLRADARGGFVWRDGRLRVDPLVGHSPAGDLNGAVSWSKEGWELAAQVRRGDPSRWSFIGIRNWPAGDMNGHFRYAVDTRRVKHARLAARLAPSEWSGWRADSGTVAVDFTPVGADSFSVLALRRGGEMTLRARTDDTGWSGHYTLTRFPLDEWAEGRASGLRGTLASGSGSAASHRGRLEVTGTLEGAGTDWLGIHAARWRMSRMQGDLLPVPDLQADVRLEDFTFLTVHWDSAGMPIHVGDRTVALPSVTAFAGDTVLSLQARADWEAGGWSLAADSARVRSGQFDWTAESPMRLSGDPRGVNFDRLVARDGEARLTMEGRWAGPGGVYDWRARASQLDLGRLGFPREWKLSGSADGVLHVTGIAGDPRWALSARARRPGAGGHFADSVVLEMAGAPSRLEVRVARGMLDGGTLDASGEVTGTVTSWPDSLTGPGLTRWLADASRWNGSVSAERLPVEGLGALIPAARGWTGRAGGTLDLAGRPGAPEFSWKVDARPLSWGDYRLDEVAANGRYREGQLEVTQLRMTRGSVAGSVVGSMPLRLALGQSPTLPEQPMDWRVDLPDADLALLPLFVPQIGAGASGRFDLTARLTGTGRYPKLAGSAKIRDGRMRLAGREEQLEGLTAELTLTDTLITLNSLSARQRKRQGAPGQVEASGVVQLKGLALEGYRFDLRLRDFAAVEVGVYAAEFDGRFLVTNAPRVGRTTLPLVVGDVELRRAVVSFDFANQPEVQRIAAATKQLYWLYRIQLSASDKLRWKPSAADIEFSAGLSLEQTRDSLIIYGDMTALRGTYHYLSNKFTMERVNLTFDNVGGVNPKLDIVAVTRVRQRPPTPPGGVSVGSTLDPIEETITVTITGRAAEPIMLFSSDAGSGQSTILSSLTYSPLRDQSGLDIGANFADDWVTRNLNRQLSDEVSRLFQGYLDDVELSRESGGVFLGQGDVFVGIGIPVAPRLRARYRQVVPGFTRPGATASASPFERDVEAEYRINRFFYVSSKLTQRRPQAGTSGTSPTAPEFNLNLKARWEY